MVRDLFWSSKKPRPPNPEAGRPGWIDPELHAQIEKEMVARIRRELVEKDLRAGLEELHALRAEANLDRRRKGQP